MPEKLISQRQMCLVDGCHYERASKGLCTKHSNEYRKSKEHSGAVGQFEIEGLYQAPPMGLHTYTTRLKALARAVPAWNRADRRVFVDAMLTKYRGELER